MVYTEVQKRGAKKNYYRAVSKREGRKVTKKRIFLGTDLSGKELARAESEADIELGILGSLLSREELAILKEIKLKYSREPVITKRNRFEAFATVFTHNSTSIEGNTLTLRETGILLFDGITPKGKSVREINEVLGHRNALDFMLEYEADISKDLILELHARVMKDTLPGDYKSQIGRYREVQVFIRGLDWTPPGPGDVPGDMKALLSWYSKNRGKVDPLVAAVYFHVGFEIIHPFIDGNGRVGRLLLNFILHRNGYPMVSIPNREKQRYYDALREAQTQGNLRPFLEFVIELMTGTELMY